jgi:superfamily I DNA/RNA helicase
MTWDIGLTGVAREIAASDDSPLRVVAGPGTGKSFALKRRVARLLENGTIPSRILAVTFTRNAAADLLEDLCAIGVDGCDQIRVGTLHSFCYALLMKREVLEILGRVPRPIMFFNKSGVMQFEGAPLLADTLRSTKYGTKREATKAVRAFEAAWARLQNEDPGWALETNDQAFHDALIQWLTFHQAIFIGELIPLVLQYLRDNPACAERSAFDHVLIDEFQDLNKAEQVLVDLLAESCNQFVVGDPDQSIYSFRYAHPEGIAQFSDSHPGTHDETLVECRRCPTGVVELAAHLIKANHPAGAVRRLNPFPGNPEGQVSIVQWPSLENEAQGIAEFCHHLVTSRGYAPRDILILCPRRLIGYGIRDVLRGFDIPAHSFYYEEALEPVEAQTSFALLTLFCDNKDRVALRYWLGLGSSTWNARSYANLREHCERTGQSPFDAMQAVRSGELRLAFSDPLLKRFSLLIDKLSVLEGMHGYALLDHLFPGGQDWSGALRDTAMLRITDDTEPSEMLELLRTQATQPEKPDDGEFARIMSLHKSKGLTSRAVVVVGCIEGLCPVMDTDLSPSEKKRLLEEQRRLFYVATTRCTEILVLSSVLSVEKRTAYKIGAVVRGSGEMGSTIASRFISELGPSALRPLTGARWIANGFS